MASQTISLVSAKAPGLFTADHTAISPSLSDNGRYVAFLSNANDLLGNLPGSSENVFAEDTRQGVLTAITNNSMAEVSEPVISGDGGTIVFVDNQLLTGNDVSSGSQVFSSNWLASSSPSSTDSTYPPPRRASRSRPVSLRSR